MLNLIKLFKGGASVKQSKEIGSYSPLDLSLRGFRERHEHVLTPHHLALIMRHSAEGPPLDGNCELNILLVLIST